MYEKLGNTFSKLENNGAPVLSEKRLSLAEGIVGDNQYGFPPKWLNKNFYSAIRETQN